MYKLMYFPTLPRRHCGSRCKGDLVWNSTANSTLFGLQKVVQRFYEGREEKLEKRLGKQLKKGELPEVLPASLPAAHCRRACRTAASRGRCRGPIRSIDNMWRSVYLLTQLKQPE